jgi:hypothetical protein
MKSLLLVLGFTLMASGCVSRAVYKKDIANAIKYEREACQSNYARKDERLRKFNQLHLDGSLR